MCAIFLVVILSAYSEARKIVFLSQPQMQMLKLRQLQEKDSGEIFDLNAITGIETRK